MLTAVLLTQGGCQKSNDIDVQTGNLAAGSECSLTPEDPCAGACIAGICRAPCGNNRECPSGMQCVGDGEGSGCVPADFGQLDLLTDCSEGCTGELAGFGREGYFYTCEGEYLGRDVYSHVQDLEEELGRGRPNIEPMAWCPGIGRRAYAVRNDILYSGSPYEDEPFDTNCDAMYFGVVGNQLVAHECRGLTWSGLTASQAKVGYMYNSGGDTYWLHEYGLYRFVPEAVSETFASCNQLESATVDEPYACSQPVYPAVGGIPEEFVGFWAMCPNVDSGQFAAADLDTCATLEWDEYSWQGVDYETQVLWLRSDGYAVDTRLTSRYTTYCTTAFRELAVPEDYNAGGREGTPVAVMTRLGDQLWFDDENWNMSEYAGETFLSARWGTLRKIPRPASFVDACDTTAPKLGF